MNIKDRVQSIELLTKGLKDSTTKYAKAVSEKGYALPGYNVERSASKGAIQRRITLIREELLELSRSL